MPIKNFAHLLSGRYKKSKSTFVFVFFDIDPLRDYWDLSNCWLHDMMGTLNYRIRIFENLGVVATKPRPFYDVAMHYT